MKRWQKARAKRMQTTSTTTNEDALPETPDPVLPSAEQDLPPSRMGVIETPVETLDLPQEGPLSSEVPYPDAMPGALPPITVAPRVTNSEPEEPEGKFHVEHLRETIHRSKETTREKEERLIQGALEAKARKLAEERLRAKGAAGNFDHREFLDDLHDGKVRNFDDIFARFPIGDGEFEVYVERKTPRRFRGTVISGIQRSIEERMSHKQFAEQYGSGSYVLTVYGPSKSGKLADDGKVLRRAYTKPVRVDIPDPYDENPPNPEMAVVAVADFGEEEDGMLRHGGRRLVGTGATEADAQIRSVELEHAENAEERRMRLLEMQQEREERIREESERRQSDLASRVLDSKDEEIRMLREEIRDMRNMPTRGETEMSGVAAILAAVRPEGPSETELRRLSDQVAEERRRTNEEVNRLRDEHRRELDRIIREKDDHLRLERERADQRIREANDLAHRRESDLRASLEQRLSDERRQHDRDLQSHRETQMLMSKTGQDSFAVQLEVKQSEINRLNQQVSELRADLESERKKTLAQRVEEFSGAAEALGFQKDEGDGGWKSALADTAMGLVQHAPALAAALRGPSMGVMAQPRSLPAPQMMHQQPLQAPPAFATEDVDMDFDPGPGIDVPPIYPGAQQPVHSPAQPNMQPAQQPPPQAIEQAGDAGEEMDISDEQILEVSDMFRQAHEGGVTPEQFAEDLLKQVGPMIGGHLVRSLPLERVNRVLSSAPDGDSDSLVRRDGKKFIAKVWEIVETKTA